MDNKVFVILIVLSTVPLSTACKNDTIWELITCGFQLQEYMDESTDLCSTTEMYNRDRIKAYFEICIMSYDYYTCSEEQQDGYVPDRLMLALKAIPCSVTVTPGCVQNTKDCIMDVSRKVTLQCTRGTYCFCNYRESLLTELDTCLTASGTDLNEVSCTVDSTNRKLLEDGIQQLKASLADRSCSSVDTTMCVCNEKLYECVSGTKEMEGGFGHLLNHEWNLIEVAALVNKSYETMEESRAWRAYQRCRSEGYPDQFDRAVMCFDNFPSQCNIRFPDTVAAAEHFSNTTFYQTSAAAVKNVQQFCHVWCRNTSHWTGLMVGCLESFHPLDMEIKSENIIGYVLNSTFDELKAICEEEKVDGRLTEQLQCAANAISRCYYLPYHLLIAEVFEFKHTLTASDAVEALHHILQACDVNITEWATGVIDKAMNDSSPPPNIADDGLGASFLEFFSGGNSILNHAGILQLFLCYMFTVILLNVK